MYDLAAAGATDAHAILRKTLLQMYDGLAGKMPARRA